MASQVEVRQPGGIGLPGALFITFVVLKLTGVIGWSWWWVAAPLWIPIAFWASIFAIVVIVAMIAALFGKKTKKSTIRYTRPRKRVPRGPTRR